MRCIQLTRVLERHEKSGDRGDLTSFGFGPVGTVYVFIEHVQTMAPLTVQWSEGEGPFTQREITELWFQNRVNPQYVAESPQQILASFQVVHRSTG